MSKPVRTTNSRCWLLVESQTPFQGSNLYGVTTDHGYVVYSYGKHFPLYVWHAGRWFGNADKYSRTTSKHKGQARPHTGHIEMLSTHEMCYLVYHTKRTAEPFDIHEMRMRMRAYAATARLLGSAARLTETPQPATAPTEAQESL